MKQQKNVQEFYDSHYSDPAYQGGFLPDRPGKNRFEKIIKHLERCVKIQTSWKALDIGCSRGEFLNTLPFSAKFGVDVSQKALEVCGTKGIKTKLCNPEFDVLPFEDDYFDIVFALEVFEHMFSPHAAIKEIKRVLKPGGILCVSVPNEILRWQSRMKILFGFVPFIITTQHIRFFSKKILRELVSSSGFSVAYCGGLGPLSPGGRNIPLSDFFVKLMPDFLPRHYLLIASNTK